LWSKCGTHGSYANALFMVNEMMIYTTYLVTDSTVLAYVLKLLNDRHDYGVKLVLLSVDEGITGYRDDSLEVPLVCFFVIFIGWFCHIMAIV